MTAAQIPNDGELVAVASLWRAAGREIVTSFLGTSMLPTIAPGVEVTIDCSRRWEVGDIIAFVAGGRLFVHRVEAASADRAIVLTRGDHRTVPDEPFEAADAVIGVITRIRVGDQWVAPPSSPQSWLRALSLSICVTAFRAGAGWCRRTVRLLRMAGSILRLGHAASSALRLM